MCQSVPKCVVFSNLNALAHFGTR
ncbi:hypothetical protein TSAR_009116 [Trichomalopsis sarcophagae]|uniref:Uncharacterized protein n=1 Tax=Trichomalopsis sarcophagae TaxID=543379 RepID=A0A232EQD2_9HYME|nr:hypothetical protein TSAR_009116 [Trichomalopsis sarcophagae]